MWNGVLLLDKPQGFTSFDVIAVLRGLSKTRKIGHTGTLDPMATGVLPLLFGCATRAEALLPDTSKTYEASFRLGIDTDTQDSTGTVLRTSLKSVNREQVEQACAQFRGEIFQVPPMYSALKQNGKKLVDLARQGIEVERKPRPVTVRRLELLSYDPQSREGTLVAECSKGTYIRTLCADIGAFLGCGGIMTGLRRTRASGFTLADAITLEEARRLAQENRLEERLLPVERLFACYDSVTVTDGQTVRFQNGGALALDRLKKRPAGICRVHSPAGDFLGLGKPNLEKQELAVLRLFPTY